MPLPISRAYLLRNLKQFWTDKLKPVDSLTGTDATFPLSAPQGKALNEKIEAETTARTTAVSDLSKSVNKILEDYIQSVEKGAANGVAELDENAIIDISQLPDTIVNMRGYVDTSSVVSSPAQGDLYVCSESGTILGIADCNENDRLLYWNKSWRKLPSGKIQSVNGKSSAAIILTAETTITPSGSITASSSAVKPEITNTITQPEFSGTASGCAVTLTQTKDVEVSVSGEAADISVKLTQDVGVSSVATGCEVASKVTGGEVSFTHSVKNKILTLSAAASGISITNTVTQPTINTTVTQPKISGSTGKINITVGSVTQPEFTAVVTQPTINIARSQDVDVTSENTSVTPKITIADNKTYSAETIIN